MPLYFFLSGLFFKEYEGFLGFFLRKVNKLLVPFVFFYLTTSFLFPNILHLCGRTVSHTQSLGISGLYAFVTEREFANCPIWFLWVLFLVNIYFYAIYKVVKNMTYNSNIIGISCSVICFVIGFLGIYWPHQYIFGFMDSAMSALPFFAMGFFVNHYGGLLVVNWYAKYLPLFIVVCFASVFFVGGMCSYRLNQYSINPILQYACGMTGTLGIILTAKYLRSLPLVTYWGRYSIMILCTHFLLLHVFMPLVRKIELPLFFQIVIVLAAVMFSYQLLIPLMKRYLPYVTAQKDIIKVTKFL